MKKYNPSKIEKKWQKQWKTDSLYRVEDMAEGKQNKYILTEFPYPSGNLHIGHWLTFAVSDVLARYNRMLGFNTLYPIGFDAFGLPAENAAIKRNLQPGYWTQSNIKYMTKQLHSMGAMFDWSRTVSTIDPDYYRWTQWIFLQLYNKGLAYRAKTLANWCPKDKTVLANEQVIQKELDGRQVNICERCDSEVEQKNIEQWMFKITAYADALIDDLDALDWPETTKLAQKNWIGRSEGAEIDFKIADMAESITVFTTRADTLAGVSLVVIAPDHVLADRLASVAENSLVAQEYIKNAELKTERERLIDAKEKSGVILKNIYCENPLNGDLVEVWIGDYVLASYGTGAVMSVPAHDQRDFEFAIKYGIKFKQVIKRDDIRESERAMGEDGVLINSAQFDGLTSSEARVKIVQYLNTKGLAKAKKNYRLRDWLLSRQRYWGVPIPMIKCEKCGYSPVSEDSLPIKLPKLENYLPADDGRSPLAKAEKWLKVKCPSCGGRAERETDTMDTFVDSSWYFIRYLNSDFKDGLADPENMKRWLPVDMYIGGAEHNTMHLLYSRFITKALHDCGVLEFNEPFKVRKNHGIVLGPDGQRMSKSRGNVVDPDALVAEYGADTVRMYLAFMAPYEQGGPWDPKGINGVARFLGRVWYLCNEYKSRLSSHGKMAHLSESDESKLRTLLHKTIKKVAEDIEALHFNTAISTMMIFSNSLGDLADKFIVPTYFYETLVRLIAPFAPHIAEEIWHEVFEHTDSIHVADWPKYEEKYLVDDISQITVQINGKTRGTVEVNADEDQKIIEDKILSTPDFAKYIDQHQIKKVIYVKGRIINFVVDN